MARPRRAPGVPGEVQLVKLEDGRWRARTSVRDPAGEFRQVVRTRSAKAAARNAVLEAAVKVQPVALTDGASPGELTVASPLSDAIALWRTEHGDKVRAQTMAQYESVLKVQVAPLADKAIGELTTGRLDAEIQAVKAMTPTRARQMRSLLREIFDLVVRHDVLANNPVLSTSTVPQRRGKVEALSPTQSSGLRALLAERTAEAPPYVQQIAFICSVQLGSTARISEVLGLRRSSLALDNDPPTALFDRTVVPGAGRGSGPVLQDVPKTEGSRLTRVLPTFAVEALRAALALPLDPGADDLVFPSLKGTPRQPGSVRRELQRLTADTEFATSHTHLFRKTAITQVARKSGIEKAAEVAGHSDSRVTRRHYVAPPTVAPDERDALNELA